MSKNTDTRLINAAISGDINLVESLIASGVDVNSQDKKGFSALHYAAQNYDAQVTKVLITSGANVDIKDSWGNTPLFRAVFNSMGRGEVIRLLLDAGADRDLKNDSNVSPFELAQTIDNYDMVQFF